MANCLDIEILLAEYAEGSLPAPEADRVSEHLTNCAACREELAQERRLRESLSALPGACCPTGVTERVLTRTQTYLSTTARHGQRPQRDERNFSRYWLLGSAGLVAAAILLVLFLPTQSTQNPGLVDRSDIPAGSATVPEEASVDAGVEIVTTTGADEVIVDRLGHSWSRAEIKTAREEAKWILAVTTQIMNRTGRSTLTDVFGRRLPQAVTGSIKSAASTYEGGQG